MRLLIKGGRVIDPANSLNAIMDLLLDEGRIVAWKKIWPMMQPKL